MGAPVGVRIAVGIGTPVAVGAVGAGGTSGEGDARNVGGVTLGVTVHEAASSAATSTREMRPNLGAILDLLEAWG